MHKHSTYNYLCNTYIIFNVLRRIDYGIFQSHWSSNKVHYQLLSASQLESKNDEGQEILWIKMYTGVKRKESDPRN